MTNTKKKFLTQIKKKLESFIFNLKKKKKNHTIIIFKKLFIVEITVLGFRASCEKCLINILNGKKGNGSLLLVGGTTEAFQSYPGPINIVIKNRKGFIRVALKTG